MKKIFVFCAMIALATAAAVAQPRAIGANLGSGLGISYQHNLGEANMLDVDVHVPIITGNWCVGGAVTYDWIDPFGTQIPWDYQGEWHWNLGVGAAGGIYGFSDIAWYAGVAGHVGVAYDFWFPLELSLDWRPNFGVTNKDRNGGFGFNDHGLYDGITLGVRYLFNQR